MRSERPRSACARLAALGLLLALAACVGTTEPSRFYELTPVDGSRAGPGPVVQLLPVRLPGAVDRAQLLTTVSANRRELADLDRWAEPLGELLARVVQQDLQQRLGVERVFGHTGRLHPDGGMVLLDVEVQQLVSDAEGANRLVARVQLGSPTGALLVTKLVEADARGASEGAEGVAEALSANLGTLCDAVVELLGELPTAPAGG